MPFSALINCMKTVNTKLGTIFCTCSGHNFFNTNYNTIFAPALDTILNTFFFNDIFGIALDAIFCSCWILYFYSCLSGNGKHKAGWDDPATLGGVGDNTRTYKSSSHLPLPLKSLIISAFFTLVNCLKTVNTILDAIILQH